MDRRLSVLVLGLVTIASGAVILRAYLVAQPPSFLVSGPAPTASPRPEAVPEEIPLPPQPQRGESHTATVALPDLPPTVDLTGSKIGDQRVAAMGEIGDVYRLAWHAPTQALFMAVVERDGMRSVWRLPAVASAKAAASSLLPERVLSLDRRPGDFTVHVDSRGVLYAQFENPGRLYRSADGVNWRPVLEGADMFWNIADDGKGTIYGSMHAVNRAVLYRSTDDGFTWEPWVDFHRVFPEEAVPYAAGDDRFRLRHLHGVAWLDGKIFVGVGDVARFTVMSADDGKTWEKIWKEGFTAAAFSAYGTELLLGPDSVGRFDLSLYDTVSGDLRSVWSPSTHGYYGYTYSIVERDGVFYAAFHTETNEAEDRPRKFGVVVSPDGERWYPFLEFGPLTRAATTTLFLAPAADRIFLSLNGSLYAFRPLDRQWFLRHEPFSQ